MSSWDLAELLGVEIESLAVWRRKGTGPPFYRIGGRVRYRADEVEQWLHSLRSGSTGELRGSER
jgi:predicted site-specific integrase-resolvase